MPCLLALYNNTSTVKDLRTMPIYCPLKKKRGRIEILRFSDARVIIPSINFFAKRHTIPHLASFLRKYKVVLKPMVVPSALDVLYSCYCLFSLLCIL